MARRWMLGLTLRKSAGLVVTVLLTAWLLYALLGGLAFPRALGGALAVTVPLALLAMVMAGLIGSSVGYAAARAPDGRLDRALMVLAAIGAAAPAFWLGMLLALALAAGLHWLPPGGFVPWQANAGGALLSLILPALALAVPAGAALSIVCRYALAEARTAPYVLGAPAAGVPAHDAFRRDGLPAALPVVLQSAAPIAAKIVLGSVIVENVFYLPGLGRLILDSLAAHNFPALGGALVVLTLLVCGTLFLVQLAAAWSDPRLLVEAGK